MACSKVIQSSWLIPVLYVENAHMQISSKPVVQVCNDWNFDAHLERRTNNFQVYVNSVYM